jgi:transposase
MKKNLFIGIDFSKSKFDVTVLENLADGAKAQEVFENSAKGYKSFLRWVKKQSKIKSENWLFCGEHTGLYSRCLSNFLFSKGMFVWLENPLQIKRSSGIKRGKTDRTDSLVIASYACRFLDRAKAYKQPDKLLESLQMLFSYRSLLVKEKVLLEVPAKELRGVVSHNETSRFIFEQSQKKVAQIKKQIGELEDKMHKLIMQSDWKENYLLALSVKGIGFVTTVCLMIHSDNFSTFETARQMASYSGVAPFPDESGTMNKGSHISHLANRELKVLLTQCARSAVQHDYVLSAYYRRKIAEGKAEKVALNNVKNKLLQTVFAIVKSKIPYQENYLNPLANCA